MTVSELNIVQLSKGGWNGYFYLKSGKSPRILVTSTGKSLPELLNNLAEATVLACEKETNSKLKYDSNITESIH